MLIEKTLIEEQVKQYDELRRQQDIIKGQMERLAHNIKNHAEKHGAKNDNGSFICDSGGYIFGKQARKSVKFNQEEAISFFKTSVYLIDAVKTVEIIDEEAVERLIGDGKISYEDLEAITETKVVYAILVKPKEEPTEAEQGNLKSTYKKLPMLKNKKW